MKPVKVSSAQSKLMSSSSHFSFIFLSVSDSVMPQTEFNVFRDENNVSFSDIISAPTPGTLTAPATPIASRAACNYCRQVLLNAPNSSPLQEITNGASRNKQQKQSIKPRKSCNACILKRKVYPSATKTAKRQRTNAFANQNLWEAEICIYSSSAYYLLMMQRLNNLLSCFGFEDVVIMFIAP
jgi:hypothetical protein